MKKYLPLLGMVLLLVALCFPSKNDLPYVAEGETAIVHSLPKTLEKAKADAAAATDEYIYILYSSLDAVAAYDRSGTFSHAIVFSNNGRGNSIKCHEGLLYILDGEGRMYVFQGKELLEYRPAGQAHNADIPLAPSSVTLEDSLAAYVIADEQGNELLRLSRPWHEAFLIVAAALLALAALTAEIIDKAKKRAKRPEKCE